MIGAAVGAITTLVFLYQALESAIGKKDAAKAQQINNQIERIQSDNELTQQQIAAAREKADIDYNRLMSSFNAISRSSIAFEKMNEAQRKYSQEVESLNKAALSQQQATNRKVQGLQTISSGLQNRSLISRINK